MNEQQLSQLDTLLQQGILLLQSLDKLYDQELTTLSSKELDKLSDITQEKTHLIDQFHQFTLDRKALYTAMGYDTQADDYSLPAEVEHTNTATKVVASYDAIKQLLTELQQKNKRNEQAIYRNQQNVEQLLAIMRGHRQQDKLYNQKGSAGLYKAQSRLGKA